MLTVSCVMCCLRHNSWAISAHSLSPCCISLHTSIWLEGFSWSETSQFTPVQGSSDFFNFFKTIIPNFAKSFAGVLTLLLSLDTSLTSFLSSPWNRLFPTYSRLVLNCVTLFECLSFFLSSLSCVAAFAIKILIIYTFFFKDLSYFTGTHSVLNADA